MIGGQGCGTAPEKMAAAGGSSPTERTERKGPDEVSMLCRYFGAMCLRLELGCAEPRRFNGFGIGSGLVVGIIKV